jgi:hypothetical protein
MAAALTTDEEEILSTLIERRYGDGRPLHANESVSSKARR